MTKKVGEKEESRGDSNIHLPEHNGCPLTLLRRRKVVNEYFKDHRCKGGKGRHSEDKQQGQTQTPFYNAIRFCPSEPRHIPE